MNLGLSTLTTFSKRSHHFSKSHNATVSMKYKYYHKYTPLPIPIMSYFRHQYLNTYMMMEETNRQFSKGKVAMSNSNENEKLPSSHTGNQNNVLCEKCCKYNTQSLILMSCQLCGKHYHKKCFSALPRLTKQMYHDICSTCLTDILPFSNLFGNEFHECLLAFQFTPFDLANLTSLSDTFKDITLNYTCRDSSDILKDIDPDQNDLNLDNIDKCKYFFPSQIPKAKPNQFSLFHLNIRSLRKNFEKFKLLLFILNHSFDIIALSETWITDDDIISSFDIDGYKAIYQNRVGRERGGVCMYIKKECFNFDHSKPHSYSDIYNHILTIKLIPMSQSDKPRYKNTHNSKLVTVCYRSPDSNNNTFIENLTPIMTDIHRQNKPSYILGDMNYNILNINHHQPTQDYYSLLTAFMYKQIITKPTRITDTTATVIDHIWHNDVSVGNNSLHSTPGIIYSDISDHLPIFLQITKNVECNAKVKISYRLFTAENFKSYKSELKSLGTNDYFVSDDVDSSHKFFCEHIIKL